MYGRMGGCDCSAQNKCNYDCKNDDQDMMIPFDHN